ncbi:nuclear transport factor 2 family protein [Zhihengliuella sp.]|uniref:YybH family protein n=1 Tax=Zhihengliuella sp. TaxID=1954483 RepID=UPI002812792B|nr:nuclear transport factor 2 family protein [Zhihengliuella sp.]
MTPSTDQVRAAASELVDAFAATDTERYFSCFAEDASFVFHTEPERLDGRAAYEELWHSWLRSGWRVTACESTHQRIQPFPGGAVFSHDVATSVSTADGEESYRERETIVFAYDGERLLAVYEHLSAVPDGPGAESQAAAPAAGPAAGRDGEGRL